MGAIFEPKKSVPEQKSISTKPSRISKNTRELIARLDRLRMLYKTTSLFEAPTYKQLYTDPSISVSNVRAILLTIGE